MRSNPTDTDWSEGGQIPEFEGPTTVVIKTPSRTWQGTAEEFIELREALNEVSFKDGEE